MIILISFEQVDNFSLFADRYFSRKSHANYTNIRSPHKPCMVITQFLSIPQGAKRTKKITAVAQDNQEYVALSLRRTHAETY